MTSGVSVHEMTRNVPLHTTVLDVDVKDSLEPLHPAHGGKWSRKGLAGGWIEVRVPEVAQSPHADEDLTRLLNWLLWEFSGQTLPAGFRVLDPQEVGTTRANVLTDPLRARADIVGAYGTTVPCDGPHRAPPRAASDAGC